jgi:hypothetical protein
MIFGEVVDDHPSGWFLKMPPLCFDDNYINLTIETADRDPATAGFRKLNKPCPYITNKI